MIKKKKKRRETKELTIDRWMKGEMRMEDGEMERKREDEEKK